MTCKFIDGGPGMPFFQHGSSQMRAFDGEDHVASRCDQCGHVFFKVPPPEVLSKFYNTTYLDISASWHNVDADYAETKVTDRISIILDIAGKFGFGPSHHYHEIGCSFGGTVQGLNIRGYTATGTDLSATAIDQGRARGNWRIACEPDIDFLRRCNIRPNVIFGNHVLEHMIDPLAYLRDLKSVLASESIVILLVPNAMALFPNAYGFDRYGWFSYPEHLNLFSPASAHCLAQAAGYDLLEIWTAICGGEVKSVPPSPELSRTPPATQALHDRMVNGALFGDQLDLVLAPTGSATAFEHRTAADVASQKCAVSRNFEERLRAIGETSNLVAISESFRSLAEQEAEAQSARRYKEQTEECLQIELALRAIQNSTIWRASAPMRWLVDRIKALRGNGRN